MEYRYIPSNRVCSQEMIIELDGKIIKNVKILGGSCPDQLSIALEEEKSELLGEN